MTPGPRVLLVAGLGILASVRLAPCQCPDGTPPPCGRPRAAAPALSVAVLTFDNLSRDTADAYLTEGLANDISSQLAQVRRLTVTSRSMVRRAALDAAPPALGRSLNAAYLVTGGIQRAGSRVRVSVELVRAATAQTIWSSQFDRTTADLLQIQQQIAEAVVAGIAGRLLPAERSVLAASPPSASEAYDHILRGDFLLTRRSQPDMDRALAEYETAVRIDPRSARAHASLGNALALCPDWGIACRGLSNDSLRALAALAISRALRLDSMLPAAYKARSTLEYDRDLSAGLRDLDRAIALAPGDAGYRGSRGWLLAEAMRLDDAQEELQRSLALDPVRPVTWEILSRVLIVRHRYPEALAALDSALRLEPELVPAWERRAELRAFLGDRTGAREDAEAYARRVDNSQRGAAFRAGIEAFSLVIFGDTIAARILSDSLSAAHSGSNPQFLALIRLGRGGAILDSASPNSELDPFWAAYPYYDPIRDHPAFRAMIERYRRNRAVTP